MPNIEKMPQPGGPPIGETLPNAVSEYSQEDQYYTDLLITLKEWRQGQEKIQIWHEQNATILKKVGIVVSPEDGRVLIENHAHSGVYPLETIQEMHTYIKKTERNIKANNTPEKRYLKEQSDLSEEIITSILAKCFAGDFYVYRSSIFGDIRGGYDIVVIDKETGQIAFVIDAVLGTSNKEYPISDEKIDKTYDRNIEGAIMYDGHKERGGGLYKPTYSIMPPVLSTALPSMSPKGEDNLKNIVDMMSLSFDNPSEMEIGIGLFLTQGLLWSAGDISNIRYHDKSKKEPKSPEYDYFDEKEIKERTEALYNMLSSEEKEDWGPINEKVVIESRRWIGNVEKAQEKLKETEKKIAKKIGMDPDEMWENSWGNI